MPDAPRYCPGCGYDLHGITTTCPECGHAADDAMLHRATIPWQRRGELGRWRAYWQTTRRVMLDRGAYCGALTLPVDDRASRRFGLLVMAVTLVLLSPVVVLLVLLAFGAFTENGFVLERADTRWPVYLAGALLGVWLYLYVLGESSVWLTAKLAGRDGHNSRTARGWRAATLSRYLWAVVPPTVVATLAMWVLSVAVAELSDEMNRRSDPLAYAAGVIWILGFGIVLLGLGPAVVTQGRLMQAGGAGSGVATLANAGVGVVGVLALPLFVIALPWSVGFAWMMVTTLR